MLFDNINNIAKSLQINEIRNNLRNFFSFYHEYPWKHHCVILLPLCLYVITSGILYGFFGDEPRAFYMVLNKSYPAVTCAMKIMSDYYLSLYIAYLIIAVRALFIHNKWELKFALRAMLLAFLFTSVLAHIIKGSFGIPRPDTIGPPRPFQFSPGYNSFPSGHAVAFISAAPPLAFWIGKKSLSVLLSLLTAAVCISRLWLGAHHPMDILGSFVIGSLAARCIFRPRRLINETGTSGQTL